MENLHWLYLQASQTKCVWGYCVINCFEIYRKEKEAYSFWYRSRLACMCECPRAMLEYMGNSKDFLQMVSLYIEIY